MKKKGGNPPKFFELGADIMIIKRDYYLNKLIKKQNSGRVKIITGIRRCGKSFLLFNLYKNYLLENGVKDDEIIAIALDDINNIKYRNPFRLNDFIKEMTIDKSKHYYIFIDEVQFSEMVKNPYVESDEKTVSFVDVLLGLIKEDNLDIYVTGSNSKMLSKDILTQFRDRADEIHVEPLSFQEIASLYDSSSAALETYLVYGGMPRIFALETDEEKSTYLKNLYSQTYIKDILERNVIQSADEILETLLKFLASSIGSLTNPYKLANRFASEKHINISSTTIAKYLKYFEEAYIISEAERYDVKGGRYFSTPNKYYFSDIGLRNALLNFRQIETNHIMENIIYNDLKRRDYNVDVGVVETEKLVDGKRQKVQLEVDFVVNKGSKRYYIQSALNVDSEEKREQETNSLKKIDDSFKKIVVLKDEILPRRDESGILYLGLEDFLLDDKAIDL